MNAVVRILLLSAILMVVAPLAHAQKKNCGRDFAHGLAQAHEAGADVEQGLFEANLQYLLCQGERETTARMHAHLQTDLMRAGRAFLDGTISVGAYNALRADREAKAKRLRGDRRYIAALDSADEDNDRVPDRLDRCTDTPPRTATNSRGCSLQCREGQAPTGGERPSCVAAEPTRVERRDLERLLATRLPFNLDCANTGATPSTRPQRWGRHIRTQGGVENAGFYVSALQVPPPAAGCEVFYEFEFYVRGPNMATLPGENAIHVLFSQKEDNLQDPRMARFTVFFAKNGPNTPFTELPLSPGRKALTDSLGHYTTVQWRVRTITAGQAKSAWSEFVETQPGQGVVE